MIPRQNVNNGSRIGRRQFVCGASAIIAGASLRESLGNENDGKNEKGGLLQAVSYNHISLESPADERKTQAFQADYFGLARNQGSGRAQRFMYLEAGFLNLRAGELPGLNHCAIEIKDFDLDRVSRILTGLGVEHNYGARLYFYDPDGQRMQITAEQFNYGVTPPERDEKTKSPFVAVRLNHISMNVTDVVKTRDFYQQLFGMKLHDEAKDGSSCILSFGEAFIEFRRGKYPGLHHYCYELKEFDKDYVVNALKDMDKYYKADWKYINDRGYATVLDESIITCMVVAPGHKPKAYPN